MRGRKGERSKEKGLQKQEKVIFYFCAFKPVF